jgi:hypothetical protein
MADLTFNLSSGVLSWTGKGRWDAVSGPHGEGKLPKSTYKVSRREITAYSGNIGKSYRDSTGKGFFIPIYPQFETTRGENGGRLGIHPDGGVYGTLGCIGIRSNAKSFFDAIASSASDVSLTLEVLDG